MQIRCADCGCSPPECKESRRLLSVQNVDGSNVAVGMLLTIDLP